MSNFQFLTSPDFVTCEEQIIRNSHAMLNFPKVNKGGTGQVLCLRESILIIFEFLLTNVVYKF